MEQCGLAYDYEEYVPTLSEPKFRWRLRQWTGTVSVPVLLFERQVIRGSFEIARFANERSIDSRLGDFEAITPWDELSETGLAEGRTRVVRCILDNDNALIESMPSFMPSGLRSPLRFMARDALRRLDRKYAHLVRPGALYQALIRTREGLAHSGSDYLLGDFSYADITMAALMEVVAPIAYADPPLGPATQSCWNDTVLADEFADLIKWRNRLASVNTTSYSQFKPT